MILAVFGNAVLLLLLLLLLSILIFQTFIPIISSAFAQEVITILPGSTDKNRPRFLDIIFYPIEKGKELTWFNDDNVEHSIVINSITEDNKTKLLTESEIIKLGDAFTYIHI
jgi:ethanolamine utilization microcompartment shell protein EutL